MSKRKEATDFILKNIERILPKSGNKEYWEEILSGMSDKAFGEFITRLENEQEVLSFYVPNGSEKKLSVERNVDHARSIGLEMFQHLYLTEPNSGTTYKTPKKYLTVDIVLRRQAQILKKKTSIPDGTRRVDDMSGQPVKPSTGSRLSAPELQTLRSQQLYRSIEELIKFRGGDEKSYQAMLKRVSEHGSVSQDEIKSIVKGKVKSTSTLRSMLLGMHLDNNL